jgi:hypothetical protein
MNPSMPRWTRIDETRNPIGGIGRRRINAPPLARSLRSCHRIAYNVRPMADRPSNWSCAQAY